MEGVVDTDGVEVAFLLEELEPPNDFATLVTFFEAFFKNEDMIDNIEIIIELRNK